MKNIILFALVCVSTSLLAYDDSDLDGVEDESDRCPNTTFMDLVDISGCTTKSLVSSHKFDVIVGVSYSESDYQTPNKTNTLSNSLQFDYYYKKFSLQLSTSYFKTTGDGYEIQGLYDSLIATSYQFLLAKSLSLRVGLGAVLPTYDSTLDNNKADYIVSSNISYALDKLTLFGGYSYSFINDEDVTILYNDNTSQAIKYQNTNALSVGVGYYFKEKFYINGAYNISNSIYSSYENIQTGSMYLYYGINNHWFTTFSYALGLSKSASSNYASFRLGYLF